MHRLWALPGFVLLLLLAVPLASAGTPTTIYAHVINVQDMPLNTQAPDTGYVDNAWFGPLAPTLTCLDVPDDLPQGLTKQAYTTVYGYSDPNLVEYQQRSTNGDPRTHPERGLARDVVVDGTQDAVLVWVFAIPFVTVEGTDVPAPQPLANLQVRATVRTGAAISVDDQAYNTGAILLQGMTDPVTLVADQVLGTSGSAQVRAVGLRGATWVYEARVPLEVRDPVLPARFGYNLRVDLYTATDLCDPDVGALMPTSVGAYTEEGLRPRLEFTMVDRPLSLEYFEPQWVGDDLVLHYSVNSAWGQYDVHVANLVFTSEGPTETQFVLQPPRPRHHVHGHSYADEALDLTWVWTNASQEMERGDYTVKVAVPNLQGTDLLESSVQVALQPAKQSPGPTPPLLVAGLAALALVLGRNRRQGS